MPSVNSTPLSVRACRAVFLGLLLSGGLSACTAIYSNHGYVPPDEDLDQIVVGIDTLDTVRETLGSSASGSVLNDSGLYYVRSRVRSFAMFEPEVVEREVVAISFDGAGTVQNIERFGLEQGQIVPLSRRVTNSGVSDVSFLRQLFGNIGRITPASAPL
jgi:outer membrane protein assembly factor BamE (lipoprotein component of BamABCDE complex)